MLMHSLFLILNCTKAHVAKDLNVPSTQQTNKHIEFVYFYSTLLIVCSLL
jgi:hypothetical protein